MYMQDFFELCLLFWIENRRLNFYISLVLMIMSRKYKHQPAVEHLILDMSDCYTWSFPEFIPFCRELYYFSSFKRFSVHYLQ